MGAIVLPSAGGSPNGGDTRTVARRAGNFLNYAANKAATRNAAKERLAIIGPRKLGAESRPSETIIAEIQKMRISILEQSFENVSRGRETE
jgi:hypothetical protein